MEKGDRMANHLQYHKESDHVQLQLFPGTSCLFLSFILLRQNMHYFKLFLIAIFFQQVFVSCVMSLAMSISEIVQIRYHSACASSAMYSETNWYRMV